MKGALVFISLIVTLSGFGILWVEDLWTNFWHWGPPFQVGSIQIKNWQQWGFFVGLLLLYQISNVYCVRGNIYPFIFENHKHKPLSHRKLSYLNLIGF
jgi:hypothetical protein